MAKFQGVPFPIITTHNLSIVKFNFRADYLFEMVDSSVKLCSQLSLTLQSTDTSSVGVLKAAFLLALSALECARGAYKDEEDMTGRKEAISSLSKALQDWICNPKVVGGKVFGCLNSTYAIRSSSSKGKKELMVS